MAMSALPLVEHEEFMEALSKLRILYREFEMQKRKRECSRAQANFFCSMLGTRFDPDKFLGTLAEQERAFESFFTQFCLNWLQKYSGYYSECRDEVERIMRNAGIQFIENEVSEKDGDTNAEEFLIEDWNWW